MTSKEKRNKSVRDSLKRRRAVLKERNLCVDCGGPKAYDDHGSLCGTCKEMRRLRENARRNRKKTP